MDLDFPSNLHNLFLDFEECDMREIKKIIIHCSATSLGVTPKEIRDYHVNVLGWSDVGYHFLITPDGEIHNGRPLNQVGSHCKGHNFDSVGICLIGGKYEFDFTWKQFRSLSSLVFDLIITNHLSYDDVYSHHDFNSDKACPRFNARLILKNIHHYGSF